MSKRFCLVFLTSLLGAVFVSRALDWDACLRYLHPDADPETAWVVQDDSNGKGAYIAKWNLAAPKPTVEQLQAVETAAQAWRAQKTLDQKTDFANWDNEQLRLVVSVMLDEINTLRAKLGLPLRTVDDLKRALRTKAEGK
jgi:hypothetical protein